MLAEVGVAMRDEIMAFYTQLATQLGQAGLTGWGGLGFDFKCKFLIENKIDFLVTAGGLIIVHLAIMFELIVNGVFQ